MMLYNIVILTLLYSKQQLLYTTKLIYNSNIYHYIDVQLILKYNMI